MERLTWISFERVTHEDLRGIENAMSLEDIREMNKKIDDLIDTMFFDKQTDRLIAKDAIKRGYLASYAKYERS